jgi:hypothetical protein
VLACTCVFVCVCVCVCVCTSMRACVRVGLFRVNKPPEPFARRLRVTPRDLSN